MFNSNNYSNLYLKYFGPACLFGWRSHKGRAFRYNPSLRAERGNLLNILLHKLAMPGFSLQSYANAFVNRT